MHTERGAHKRLSVATAGVMLFRGPLARCCTQKAVPTQGGAHKRRSIATAGVMSFKGPQARRCTENTVPTQGGAPKRRPVATGRVLLFKGPQARWYTQKAVHTKGGLWPPQQSCYIMGGAHRTRCLHQAVHTKAGLPQESCYLKGLRGGLCFLKRHMGWGGSSE